ncbi:flagellar biosynthetic protein FliO, partial [Planctomycetaceae bacterium]|nr:flagellar biosynthetic protein FliO [Planctomycetaceae bacterium]
MKHHLILALVFVLGVCFTQTISAQPNPAPTSQAPFLQSPTAARTITPSTSETSPANSTENPNSSMRGRSIGTTLAALGAILLLFLGLVQIWRRHNPQLSQSLPETAWEVLGSAPLDQKYQMTIVRVGARLLVLGKSDQGLQTLSEITNGEEVAQLMLMCQTTSANPETTSFG